MPIRHKHAPVDDAPPPDLHDEPTGAMVIPVQFIQVNTRRPRRVAVQALPRGLIGLAEVLAVALALVGLAVASGAARLADGEAAWAIRLVAAAGPGSAPLGTDRSHGLMTALLTGWASMTGALGRHATAVGAAREATLAAAVLCLAMTWLAVRQLRLGAAARAGAVLLIGGVPVAAAALAGTVRPGPFAAAIMLFALVVVAGSRVGPAAALGAIGGLAAAVVLVPPLLPALLVGLGVLTAQGDLTPRLGTGRRAVLAALVVVGAVLTLGHPVRPTLPSGNLWLTALLAVLGAATVASAVRYRWLRAPAATGLALLALITVRPDARADLVALALPVLVLVAVVWLDEIARYRPVSRLGAGALVMVACLALAAGTVALVLPVRPALPRPAASAAATWVAQELPAEAPVRVDEVLWPELVRAGTPAARLRLTDDAPRWRLTSGSPAADPAWPVLAVFGNDKATVTVRCPAAVKADMDRRRAARTDLGRALAANPHLTLSEPARAALTAGEVDLRVTSVLIDLAGGHTLSVTEFTAAPGERDTARRGVLISAVDGRSADQPEATDLVREWLANQLPLYRPRAVETGPGGLSIRFALGQETP